MIVNLDIPVDLLNAVDDRIKAIRIENFPKAPPECGIPDNHLSREGKAVKTKYEKEVRKFRENSSRSRIVLRVLKEVEDEAIGEGE